MKHVRIAEQMESSGVKFGTSGARGLVTAMTDEVCYAYTAAFLQHLRGQGVLQPGHRVALAGDLRSSTTRILGACASAALDSGYTPVACGRVPSPAVALYGLDERVPAIMVTGSHIPDDRNGIKFNTPSGEILKEDEAGIRAQEVALPDRFDARGMLRSPWQEPAADPTAAERYVQRWLRAWPADALAGLRIAVYGHSAVGRELLVRIFEGLGAEVVRLAWSEAFIPVDTEAIRPEDVALAAQWAKDVRFDALVSTDGDSDRPLLADERGRFLRGDVAGILCARALGADVVVTPVSSNTAVEACGKFTRVVRTRIGSPFVIEQMLAAVASGARRVVGYEANGGFLTASPIPVPGGTLSPLPTRDPVIVQLAAMIEARQRGLPLSALLSELPARTTASDRLVEFPTERSQPRIAELIQGGSGVITKVFPFGQVKRTDTTDGLRITFEDERVVHLRPSGNAPELRCYVEAHSEQAAADLLAASLKVLSSWR